MSSCAHRAMRGVATATVGREPTAHREVPQVADFDLDDSACISCRLFADEFPDSTSLQSLYAAVARCAAAGTADELSTVCLRWDARVC